MLFSKCPLWSCKQWRLKISGLKRKFLKSGKDIFKKRNWLIQGGGKIISSRKYERVDQNANKDCWYRTMEGSRCVEEISYHWAIWWEEGKCAKIFISLFIFPGVNKSQCLDNFSSKAGFYFNMIIDIVIKSASFQRQSQL